MEMIRHAVATKTTIVGRYITSAGSSKFKNLFSLRSSPSRALQSTSLIRYPSSIAKPILELPSQLHSKVWLYQSILRQSTRLRRSYSADNSTVQGTIGKGSLGVEDETRRVTELLQAPEYLNEKERMIFEKLRETLEPVKLEVQDISGGCGSMYGIEIVSERFRGLSMLKQQRLVNQALGEEIKGWHGMQLKTKVP